MATAIEPSASSIAELLGAEADDLLSHGGYRQARWRDRTDQRRRKAFQRPMEGGVLILNTIQNVYLAGDVTIG